METKTVEAKDLLGTPLQKGDFVAFANRNGFGVGQFHGVCDNPTGAIVLKLDTDPWKPPGIITQYVPPGSLLRVPREAIPEPVRGLFR